MSSSEVKHLADPTRPGVGRLSFVVNGKPEPWTKFRKRESGEEDVKEPENEAYVAYEIRFFIDPYELEEPKGRSNAIGVERSNGTMKLWHTYVPESMRGKGIAEIVVEQAMEWAYANLFFTPATLTASIIEAWFSWSLTTMSSLVRSVCTAEAFAE